MDVRTSIILLFLLVVLLSALGVAAFIWSTLGEVTISVHGILALVLGVGLSLAVGIGLMTLIFYSARNGYDEDIG